MQETWVPSLGREDPLEKEMASHSSILAWKTDGQRSLVGYSPWGHKESDTTERLSLSQVLAIVNSAATNKKMHLLGLCFSLAICPGVGLQGHMVALFLVFKGTSIPFSIVAVPICIPTNSAGGSPSLYTLSSTCCSWIFW